MLIVFEMVQYVADFAGCDLPNDTIELNRFIIAAFNGSAFFTSFVSVNALSNILRAMRLARNLMPSYSRLALMGSRTEMALSECGSIECVLSPIRLRQKH